MEFKATRKQALDLALQELGKKLKLESTFRREISRLFNRMLEDNKRSITVNGTPVNADNYTNAWETIIDNHYQRVQNAFIGSISLHSPGRKQEQQEPTQEQQDEIDALFFAALARWREQNKTRHPATPCFPSRLHT